MQQHTLTPLTPGAKGTLYVCECANISCNAWYVVDAYASCCAGKVSSFTAVREYTCATASRAVKYEYRCTRVRILRSVSYDQSRAHQRGSWNRNWTIEIEGRPCTLSLGRSRFLYCNATYEKIGCGG